MECLICNRCNTGLPLDTHLWRCVCGGLLDIRSTPAFPWEKIRKRPPDMWRYREALPIADDRHIVSFGEGFTPMIPVPICGHEILVKQEHLFPSGSYKDRGASVLISHVQSLGIERVVEDSSGNAGSAVAAYCARAGIDCDIYVPASVSAAKLKQIEAYGARLHKVPGSRQDTADAVMDAAAHHYYASHSWNPFFFHGTKTFAFEVVEQLGLKAPDTVILPAGNGTLLLGAHIGFTQLFQAGVIDKLPRLIAIQAANCAPLYDAFENNRHGGQLISPQKTIAEGIAIMAPVRREQILAAVRESKGEIIRVTENQIHDALVKMRRMGHFIEPTSAAVVAGVEKFLSKSNLRDNEIKRENDLIVSAFTGHGLKSP